MRHLESSPRKQGEGTKRANNRLCLGKVITIKRNNEIDKFQFVEQNSVECWCDFGANLVQHFMRRYSRCSRYRTKSHDKSTISHDISRYSRYQTLLSKLEEIKTLCLRHSSKPTFRGGFLFLSLRTEEQ